MDSLQIGSGIKDVLVHPNDFDATISRAELHQIAPDLLACLREIVGHGLCRQNNAAERRMLAEDYRRLAQKAVKRFPGLKFDHMGAETIINGD
jgi:hypothetical protein